MNTVDFDITGPGLTFPTSECSALAHFALVGRLQRLTPADVSQLIETPVLQLVDGARVVDDLGKGADALEPAVTQHIVERLGLGLRRATNRLGLPYALARAKAIEDARTADQLGSISQPGPIVRPDPGPVLQAQPASTAFGAQTSIELGVAEAMTSGRFVAFDEATFGRVYVPQMAGAPRPVELELERGAGDWKSVRVVKPLNATAADVANALFGTPEDAQFVVGRGDRWSFAFPPSGVLAEPYDSWWRQHIETDEGGGPLELIRGRAPGDPLLGLDDEAAKLRALDSVAGRHTDGDQGAVLQRLEIIASHLAAIATAAGPLGVADAVQPALDRIKERMAACVADPAEAQKWSAHTVDQLTLLSEARTGFEAITQQMFASGVPAVSTPEGEQLVGDVTASMQAPTVDLTNAYARVVTASDQLDLAQGRLATAKERLAAYPFDMADRMLAMIRKRVATLDDYATIPLQSYSRARLDALQAELSAQVAALRTAIVNGDGSAAMRLGELKTQLAMLDLQSTVGSTISLIADLQGMLFASESWQPDTEREWAIYAQLKVALAPWRALGDEYDELWRAGKDRDESTMAQIRKRVEALRKDTPLPGLIQQVASFQKDEADRQRIIAIGVMIAAVLISIATGGFASGAIAATGGAVAGFVGGVVGAGVEALTFTAITGTLNADQTFGGFMAELGINFATFGGLRAISGTAKVLAGAGKLTLAGTAAEMTVEGLWMVAVDKAGEEIRTRLANGEKMTTQSAATIFGHQMLISFAGRVIARGLGAVAGSRSGIAELAEVKAYLAKQQEAQALARQFLAKGDDSLGAALVQADTNALRAEVAARQRIHEIAIDPRKAKRFGIELSADELAKLTAGTRSAARELAEREIGTLMQRVEIHADHAIAEPAVFAELVAKHRKLGSTVVEGTDAAGNLKARIAPLAADGTFGAPFTLHSRLGAEVEEILAAKGLQGSSVVHDYLVARAGDRARALADLRKVHSPAELNALMEKTLEPQWRKARELDQCFVAGTLVLTADGRRPIETLEVGDHVVATDPADGRSGPCPVTALTRHPDRPLIRMHVGNDTIECTDAHPFWVVGHGWVRADELTPGAVVAGTDMATVLVSGVARTGRAEVYNLTVGGRHTYHVSAAEVLVHNKPWEGRVLPGAVVEARNGLDMQLVTMHSRTTQLRGQADEIPRNRPDRATLIERSRQLQDRIDTLRDDIHDASTLDEVNRLLRPEINQAETAFAALQAEVNATWVPRPTTAEVTQIDAYTVAFGQLRTAVDTGNAAAQASSRAVLDRIENVARSTHNVAVSPTSRLLDHLQTTIAERTRLDTTGPNQAYGQQLPCQASAAATALRGQTYHQVETMLGIPARHVNSAAIDQPGHVRLVWTLDDGSRLFADRPGLDNSSPWQVSREPHLSISPPGLDIHISQEGVAVPDRSAAAHVPIRGSRLFDARIRGDTRPADKILKD